MSDPVLQQSASAQDSEETTIRNAPARLAAGSSSDLNAAARPVHGGRSRTRAMLVLTVIALLPAAVGGHIFGGWDRLPPVGRWAIIGIGLACTVGVVYLLLTSESDETS